MNNLIRASKWKVNHTIHIYPDIGEWSRIIKRESLSDKHLDSLFIALFTFTESENNLLWGHYRDMEITLKESYSDLPYEIYITRKIHDMWSTFIKDIEMWKKYHKPVTQEQADKLIENSMGMGNIPMFLINDLNHNKNEKY